MLKNITIVCGPTSSGKSDFVLSLAQNSLPALIISADSRQFYKDIPIVSGQDDADNFPDGITLVGQGFLDSKDEFSISQFQKYFLEQIKKFPKHNIFVVGGSGLYLKAISQNLETTHIPQNKSLREGLSSLSLSELQERLKKVNIKKFNLLNNSDVNNPRRLIRAIEVSKYKGVASEIWDLKSDKRFFWIGLKKSKDKLIVDIKKRVTKRIDLGAIEEVKNLLEKHPNQSLPVYTAIGVKQIIQLLNGKIDKTQLINMWTQAETNYAKRQMVWFKKQAQIVWYDNDI